MHCMRCGREIGEDRVFCADCLVEMEKYPVKPGTAVRLPQRTVNPAPRKNAARKKAPTPEETIRKLRGKLRFFVIAWLVTLLVAAALAWPAYQYLVEEEHFSTGQNYSVFQEMVSD